MHYNYVVVYIHTQRKITAVYIFIYVGRIVVDMGKTHSSWLYTCVGPVKHSALLAPRPLSLNNFSTIAKVETMACSTNHGMFNQPWHVRPTMACSTNHGLCPTTACVQPRLVSNHGLCPTMACVQPWLVSNHGLCPTMACVQPWLVSNHGLCPTMACVQPWLVSNHGLCPTIACVQP